MSSPYHKILGIDKDASKSEIKKAYRSKALSVHPDVNNSPEAQKLFIELAKAYEILISDNYTQDNKPRNSKKYWDVYQPPTNDEEYKAWKKVDDERREYFKKKAKQETIKSKQTFAKDYLKFKKSAWYFPFFILYYFIMLLFIAIAFSGICIPIYVKWYQAEYKFTNEIILIMGICAFAVSFTLLYYLKDLKKSVDPYFYGS